MSSKSTYGTSFSRVTFVSKISNFLFLVQIARERQATLKLEQTEHIVEDVEEYKEPEPEPELTKKEIKRLEKEAKKRKK